MFNAGMVEAIDLQSIHTEICAHRFSLFDRQEGSQLGGCRLFRAYVALFEQRTSL